MASVATLEAPGPHPASGSASTALLGRTVEGEPLPRMRRRHTPFYYRSDPFWGWMWPLLVMVLAGFLHFFNVATPHNITFDETYYAKDAYSLLIKHYATTFVDNPNTKNINEADQIINSGSTKGIFAGQPNMVVHPDVGKWMIAGGEWLFGMNSFGWRFSSALFGTLLILVLCRLVRRLTGSTLLGCIAGLLLTFDGLEFVMSRIALLDIFLAFWLVCATHCLVADRDWARVRLAKRYETSPLTERRGFGPVRGLVWRPWRVAAGVCFGLACGTKWNGVFFVFGLGLLAWAWDCGLRRSLGVRWAPLKSALVDGVPAFVSIVLIGLIVYVVSWMGFLTHAQKFEDAFGHPSDGPAWSSVNDFGGHPTGPIEGALHDLDILWNYHIAVYDFHTGSFIDHATHPFQSNPGGWLLINRPLGVAATSGNNSVVPDCPEGQTCVRQILAIGTPVLWWGGVAALIVGLGYWAAKRDWRFGIPVVGVLVGWLPWFRWDQRPIFFYYAVVIIPFTVIALTLVLGKILGSADASVRRRRWGAAAVGLFVVLVGANFTYFYPILTDGLLTNAQWNDRMWLTHWI
ncbi:MAG: dolichyl-phosphate-mannose--protein mannosyltransferase [Nocardioidaceae bacterium]